MRAAHNAFFKFVHGGLVFQDLKEHVMFYNIGNI